MARGKKTRKRSKSQAKTAKRQTRQLVIKSKRTVKPSKRAAAQYKRSAKKLRTAAKRSKIRASTRKVPRLRIIKGPSFNLFAPLKRLTKPQARKIRRRVREHHIPPPKRITPKQKQEFEIKQKEVERSSLERLINKRNEWLANTADLPSHIRKSARRNIRAELRRLTGRMERVERELFRKYAARDKASRGKGSPRRKGKK
jgi:hypothetical protein